MRNRCLPHFHPHHSNLPCLGYREKFMVMMPCTLENWPLPPRDCPRYFQTVRRPNSALRTVIPFKVLLTYGCLWVLGSFPMAGIVCVSCVDLPHHVDHIKVNGPLSGLRPQRVWNLRIDCQRERRLVPTGNHGGMSQLSLAYGFERSTKRTRRQAFL